jgi:iron(II)-dependent oxidoreductase
MRGMFALDTAAAVDTPAIRTAGRELLSLALMDARNHTLRLFAAYEAALAERGFVVPKRPELEPPLWLLGHLGWFQEFWIARNVERHRGAACDPSRPKLASIESSADRWYDPRSALPIRRWDLDLPDLEATRQYLVDTLETTLDLLAGTEDGDDTLYFYRLAVLYEDGVGEALVRMAQTLGFAVPVPPAPQAVPLRDALSVPARRWQLGTGPGGFAFDHEQPAHEVAVPEFEIDAQPVCWAQYAEFVEDGGYDERRWWTGEGWDWIEAEARRCPRHVEQLRQGVMAHRFGRLARVPLEQPVLHVSAHEAQAWCRWAGRRLPTEVEWELAASTLASRGFRWGEVWEWTATPYRAYAGFAVAPWRLQAPQFGTHQALRGASFATRGRLKHPRHRASAPLVRDDLFCGFRSCAA